MYWSLCPSVGPENVLWKNGRLDPDIVWMVSGVNRGTGVLDGSGNRRGKGQFFWGGSGEIGVPL